MPLQATLPLRTARHRDVVFESSPVATWCEDWSAIAAWCRDHQHLEGSDLRAWLEVRPNVLHQLIEQVRIVEVNRAYLAMLGADRADAFLGPVRVEQLGTDAIRSFLQQIVAVSESETSLELELMRASIGGRVMDGLLRWVVPTDDDGHPDYSAVAVMLIDVTVVREARRAKQEHLEQLASLAELGREMASTLDPAEVLARIVAAARRGLGVDQALIVTLDGDDIAVTSSTVGSNAVEPTSRAELEMGLSGWVIANARTAVSDDVVSDERIGASVRKRLEELGEKAVAEIVAPLVRDGAVLGVLVVRRYGAVFTDAEVSYTEMLASDAIAALRNARLYQEAKATMEAAEQAHEELKLRQAKLLQAQKLEAIGSLASGIAHEINTPIQYVGDNVRFVAEAVEANATVLAAAFRLAADASALPDAADAAASFLAAAEDADYEFLSEEVPAALEQTLEGVDRVATIVRAMKDFAHPGSDGKTLVDINEIIRNAVEISRNEWKYTSDVTLHLDDAIPRVPAATGPLGQALLTIIVNAGQAIAEAVGAGRLDRGQITITSMEREGLVEIRISDNGPGIPTVIRDRVFDPFFTTKPVGSGSGQGLAIARSVIVEQHDGTLELEDGAAGDGATFVLGLPLADEAS